MTADTAVNDILEPCYFAAEQRLFGCWHPGHGRRAAILCMPIGHEYLRMHRAGRQLAVQLSRAGIHALRFDYTGSGDSAGDNFSLAQAQGDIGEAIAFARSKGALRLTLIGVRIGAALALSALSEPGVDSMVLWEPVFDGAACRAEWSGLQRTYESQMGYAPALAPPECLGFVYSSELWSELAAISAAAVGPLAHKHVQVIDGQGTQKNLVNSLRPGAASLTHCEDASPAIWRREADEALVPFQTLRVMASWVAGLAP